MCSGILFVGVSVALLHGDLQYSVPPSVVMGGGIWALSNFAVLPLVKLLGIGLGFSLYHFQNMIVGYLVGRNGLFGLPRLQPAFAGSLYVCDLGCLLVLVSFVGLLLVEGRGSDSEKEKEPGPAPSVHGKGQLDQIEEQHEEEVALDRNLRLLESSGFSAFAVEVEDDEQAPHSPDAAPPEAETERRKTWRKVALGVLLAMVAGSLTGVQSVPATLYGLEHPEYPTTAVFFPQCLGAWFASTGIYLLYGGIARLRRKPVLHAVIRPAMLSGFLWAVGFIFMIQGIHELGFAVGYTLDAVGPIIIASIMSMCWFKEISGRRQLMIYWSAEALQLLGVILITAFSKQ
ncbi:Transmembrane protein 144 homolog B (Transmembrane protein 144 homolog 2) [Durusdinium trenchii]